MPASQFRRLTQAAPHQIHGIPLSATVSTHALQVQANLTATTAHCSLCLLYLCSAALRNIFFKSQVIKKNAKKLSFKSLHIIFAFRQTLKQSNKTLEYFNAWSFFKRNICQQRRARHRKLWAHLAQFKETRTDYKSSPRCVSCSVTTDVGCTQEMTYVPKNRQLFVFLSCPRARVALQLHCVP